MPCAVSSRCSQNPSRPASKQHATSAAPPSWVRARERSSAISASSAPVSPPSIRCSLDFLAPVRRAATSHDEKLSSMAMWTVFSDGMVSGSPVWLRTPATLNVQSSGVRPHSIWNQISIGLPFGRPGGECSASRRSFFKSRYGLLVLGRMARTRADVREAELLEDLADRALVVSDAEALGHDLLQVHPAPAHDSMDGALRAGFNDLGEL